MDRDTNSDAESGSPAASHARSGRTLLMLGMLVVGLLAFLFLMIGFPLLVRASGDTPPSSSAVSIPGVQSLVAPMSPADATPDEVRSELNAAREELRQSRENLLEAADAQRRIRLAFALFLAVFALIAAVILIQVYRQARGWDRQSLKSIGEVDGIVTQLAPLKNAHAEIRRALPELLKQVGDQPLGFQGEGAAFRPEALAVLDEIDHLAYLGDARFSFREFSSQAEAAVYLNGLLISAAAHLARSDPWHAIARFHQFFGLLARYPEAVERRRIAQAYSYRALAAYQVLDTQDAQPSWLRKMERSDTDSLSRQAFEDVERASAADPDWKHSTFVEALLCGRFYILDGAAENGSRRELMVRGLRRAVSLYKGLIEGKSYPGPARHHLACCLKRIAEQTGEKSDFSEFGHAVSSFPSDEELSDDALAARHPNSRDRFLWQWMMGDEALFSNVERLNLAEYRAFWIRMLDNKVRLRNWRADWGELQQRNPAMKEWSVQLVHPEPALSLANVISRRQERFDAPVSGF